MEKHELDEIDREIGRIKILYKRAVEKDDYEHGTESLEIGKLLERVVASILRKKGLKISSIGGSRHSTPDLKVEGKQIILSHSTLYLEDSVLECCNVAYENMYRSDYVDRLKDRIAKYFKERKKVFLICSFLTIFPDQNYFRELERERTEMGAKDFKILELGFQVTYENLDRELYESIERYLARYF